MPEVELVRFVVLEVESRSGVERGLLRGSSRLQKTGIFSAAEEEFLEGTFRFFNTCLPKPERVARANRPGAEPKAVSWFKPAATHTGLQSFVPIRSRTGHIRKFTRGSSDLNCRFTQRRREKERTAKDLWTFSPFLCASA